MVLAESQEIFGNTRASALESFKFGFIAELCTAERYKIRRYKIQDTRYRNGSRRMGFYISCILYLVSLYLTAKQQFENKTAPFIDSLPFFSHYAQISTSKFVNFLKILNSALYKSPLVWYNDRA